MVRYLYKQTSLTDNLLNYLLKMYLTPPVPRGFAVEPSVEISSASSGSASIFRILLCRGKLDLKPIFSERVRACRAQRRRKGAVEGGAAAAAASGSVDSAGG